MKILKLALLFCLTAFAMEKESSILTLDEKGMIEFRNAKQKLVDIGQSIPNASSNRFLDHFKSLAQKNNDELCTLFNQCQPLIQQLHNSIIAKPKYQKCYNEAVTGNDDRKWKSWRGINSDFMVSHLKNKGFKFPSSSAQFIELNADLNDDALNNYTAISFLIYYARQTQREKTGKDLPSIEIK